MATVVLFRTHFRSDSLHFRKRFSSAGGAKSANEAANSADCARAHMNNPTDRPKSRATHRQRAKLSDFGRKFVPLKLEEKEIKSALRARARATCLSNQCRTLLLQLFDAL